MIYYRSDFVFRRVAATAASLLLILFMDNARHDGC